jgi:transcriptional regulator with XRE-family HTH domain
MRKTINKKALKEFGKNLKRIREKKDFTMRELSHYCDIDYSKIGKIEKGQINITLDTIMELARGLEIHPKKLFDFEVD